MKQYAVLVCTILVTTHNFCVDAYAHEVDVHKKISEIASNVSSLNIDPLLLGNLGVEPGSQFKNSKGSTRQAAGLIIDGADFEDDSERPINHFFDPLYDRPLTYFGSLRTGLRSHDWALEEGPNNEIQHFSLYDARDYLYKALTSPAKAEREKNFGLTFQALGHVIHHLQDMTQPQHVRNDGHLDRHLLFGAVDKPFYNPSRYEKYTLDNLSRSFVANHMALNGYPKPVFPRARQFWHTEKQQPQAGRGIAEFTNTNFLSQGSNFDGNYFGNTSLVLTAVEYPLPKWNQVVTTARLTDLLAENGTCPPPVSYCPLEDPTCLYVCQPNDPECVVEQKPLDPVCQLTGEIDFYGTTVTDNHLGGVVGTNQRASSFSIFDQDLRPMNRMLFSLNRFNFEATYPYILPRAVAYSAGLIDFFFRGRLEINDISEVDGKLRIEVRNVSGTKNPLKNGKFELFYDSPDGVRHKLTVFDNADVGELIHESLVVLTAEKPEQALVDHLKDKPLILVYKGIIGEEEAVASAVMEMPYSGFLVNPNYADTNGVWAQWLVYNEGGAWKAQARNDFMFGPMDWKGWYVNNKPTKVLTWDTYSVYENGRILAVSPTGIQGAALTRGADGRPMVVVISSDASNKFVVYQRPAKRSESSAMYDPASATDGWKVVYNSYVPNPKHRAPMAWWYFNGAGTEAQTLIGIEVEVTEIDQYGVAAIVKKTGLDRLKYTSQGGGSIQSLGNLDGYTGTTVIDHKPAIRNVCGKPAYAGGTLSATFSATGEYIVGVDYLDDKEILLKSTINETRTENQKSVITIVEETSNGVCSSYIASSEGDYLYGRSGTSTLLNGSQNPIKFSDWIKWTNLKTCKTGGHPFLRSGTNSGESEYAIEAVRYLDLRSQLRYSLHETEKSNENDVNTNGNWIYSGQYSLTDVTKLSGKTGVPEPQTVNSESLVLDNSGSAVRGESGECNIGSIWLAGTRRSFPTIIYRDTYVNRIAGSWLTDTTGRVLVSLDRGTGSIGATAGVRFGQYQYLTDSNLLSLIPPAPGTQASDARFYPAGLVR